MIRFDKVSFTYQDISKWRTARVDLTTTKVVCVLLCGRSAVGKPH